MLEEIVGNYLRAHEKELTSKDVEMFISNIDKSLSPEPEMLKTYASGIENERGENYAPVTMKKTSTIAKMKNTALTDKLTDFHKKRKEKELKKSFQEPSLVFYSNDIPLIDMSILKYLPKLEVANQYVFIKDASHILLEIQKHTIIEQNMIGKKVKIKVGEGSCLIVVKKEMVGSEALEAFFGTKNHNIYANFKKVKD